MCHLTSFTIPSCLVNMRVLRQSHGCQGNNLQGNSHSSPQQGDQMDEVTLRVTLLLKADMEQNTHMKHQIFRTEEKLCHTDRQTPSQQMKSFCKITLFVTVTRHHRWDLPCLYTCMIHAYNEWGFWGNMRPKQMDVVKPDRSKSIWLASGHTNILIIQAICVIFL